MIVVIRRHHKNEKEVIMSAVVVENIIKTYGKKKEVTALSDISFNVSQGQLFGIIGPDGAGKTSLFRILTTLLLPDSGKATVDGFDVVKEYKAIRKRVGYMPTFVSFLPITFRLCDL